MQDLIDEGVELNLDDALSRTYARRDELISQRNRRRRVLGGGAAAVLVALGAFGTMNLGSDDPDVQIAGGGTTPPPAEVAPEVTERVVPEGFTLDSEGDVWVLTRTDESLLDRPGVDLGDVQLGAAIIEAQGVEVSGLEASASNPASGGSVVVHLVCVGANEQILELRYQPVGDTLVVNARVTADAGSAPCADGAAGSSLEIPLPAPFVPGTVAVVDPSL